MKFQHLVLALASAVPGLGCDECDVGDDRCDGTVRTYCHERPDATLSTYELATEDCALKGLTCGVGEGHAVCALSSSPDPRCSSPGWFQGCDGTVRTLCLYGLLVVETECADQGFVCAPVTRPNGTACIDPNDRCFGTVSGWYCDGDDAYVCVDQRTGAELSCGACYLDQGLPYSTLPDGTARDCRQNR